jgi:tetratricopeptide (TPR) repeat protein
MRLTLYHGPFVQPNRRLSQNRFPFARAAALWSPMRKIQKFVLSGAPILIAWAVAPTHAQKVEERLDMIIREDFFAGLAGDTARFDRAMKKCEEELAKDPKNFSALVWHGGGLHFQGGQAFARGDSATGMELNRRGMKEMADAVALAPDSLQTRIPRGAILLGAARYVDDSIGRPMLDLAVADYEKVYEMQSPSLKTLGTHAEGELLGGLADVYRRLGNTAKSREYLERIVADLPGSAYEKQAKRWLADLAAVPRQARFCLGCHIETKARP